MYLNTSHACDSVPVDPVTGDRFETGVHHVVVRDLDQLWQLKMAGDR